MSPRKKNNFLSDISDGLDCKDLDFSNTIAINLYDLEICNPIGASKKIHKSIMFYYNIVNLDPWWRNQPDNIQLVFIAPSIDYAANPQKVLEPVIDELKNLENNKLFIKSNGIKSDSLFNKLTDFHVCEFCLPPCAAHDLLEGIAKHDLTLAIDELPRTHDFHIQETNIPLNKHPFSHENSCVRSSLLMTKKPCQVQPVKFGPC